jgi:hypothetical protein
VLALRGFKTSRRVAQATLEHFAKYKGAAEAARIANTVRACARALAFARASAYSHRVQPPLCALAQSLETPLLISASLMPLSATARAAKLILDLGADPNAQDNVRVRAHALAHSDARTLDGRSPRARARRTATRCCTAPLRAGTSSC